MKKIALFASGSGSNAENIIRYFESSEVIQIDSLWSNKKDAYALQRAKNLGVEDRIFSREEFYNTDTVIRELQRRKIDLIVLAGFLWLVPSELVEKFPIINIHPALLPAYGGKGMYGAHVHQAVIQNGETQSGITIHLVNSEYDKGEHLFQATCPVFPGDSPDDLASRIHELEYAYFPKTIEKFVVERLIECQK